MRVKALTALLRFIHFILVMSAKVLLAAMVILTSVNVFMRYVMNSGIGWSEEISLVIVVWFTFISMVLGVKQRLHISLCLFPKDLTPTMDFLLPKLSDLVTLFLGYVMIHYGWILVGFTSTSILPASEFQAAVMYFPLVLAGILVTYESLMNLFGFDKGDENLDRTLSGGRCSGDA
jgi:TRAP-type C4-dicarboxylate transport system permease small subunit